ncbi:hypothetical protein Despr_1156 [Candidatus Vecturithrix granuli]|uniref:TIR domain-containing protein n=1 Tax=Vecturithrix granuli TaxID=1499967 RepID=A0A081BUR4_VECG1|nr:hypothetical protein Despr_1156 [Candidatus Vecturithrix granuli]
MATEQKGKIITFYSYKGGTGRSMALANAACLLAKRASSPKGVLMVDWDLEAPGLHRFFRQYLSETTQKTIATDTLLDSQPGLIDLFWELDAMTRKKAYQSENRVEELFEKVGLQRFILSTNIASLFLLKAGRFDEKYSMQVNTFQWEQLYRRVPWLIPAFARYLMREYQYILIDSRTGITDISGICTMLMPEKLVAVFTPNAQSLFGVLDLIRQATEYRKNSDDLRPLVIFPLPSRIEATEPELRYDWRYGNERKNLLGYQGQFEKTFQELYHLEACSLETYFNEVQIQHVPSYAYGEEIAVLSERGQDKFSLTRSYEVFTNRLTTLADVWDYPAEVLLKRKMQAKDYDVFLLYNSLDRQEVQAIAEQLMQHGVLPWLDITELRPGMRWRDAIKEAIMHVKSIAVCTGRGGIDLWQNKEMHSLLQQFIEQNRPVIPVILKTCEEVPKLPLSLADRRWVDFRKDTPHALMQLIWGITGKRPEEFMSQQNLL